MFDLYNINNTRLSSGKWQPAYWYANGGSVVYQTSSWVLNPFNLKTLIPDIYSINVDGSISLSVGLTPIDFFSACGSQAYLSGTIHTQPTFRQLYGYFEAQISVPYCMGVYCSFSLQTDQQFPPQIDIARILSLSTPNFIVKAGVWDPDTLSIPTSHSWSSPQFFQTFDPRQFHAYGVDWQSDYTTFYVDQVQVFQIVTPKSYRHFPMFPVLSINSGVAGTEAGPITNPTILPVSMRIGYCKAWKHKPF